MFQVVSLQTFSESLKRFDTMEIENIDKNIFFLLKKTLIKTQIYPGYKYIFIFRARAKLKLFNLEILKSFRQIQ